MMPRQQNQSAWRRRLRLALLCLCISGLLAAIAYAAKPSFVKRTYDWIYHSETKSPYLQILPDKFLNGMQISTGFYAFAVSLEPPCGETHGSAIIAAGDLALCISQNGAFVDLSARDQPVEISLPDSFPQTRRKPIDRLLLQRGIRHAALRRSGDGWDIAVSYYSKGDGSFCVRPTIAHTRLGRGEDGAVSRIAPWRVVTPFPDCLVLNEPGQLVDSSGSLAYAPDGSLWAAYGSFGVEDTSAPNQSSVYQIDTVTGATKKVAQGLRNPLGLEVDATGLAWVVDMGPRGGDELNLVSQGSDFGWPRSSLGSDYGHFDRDLQPDLGRHDTGDAPVYGWVPSIAPSDIAKVPASALPAWANDLLISSLRAGTIYRVRIEDERVQYVEPIETGYRLRDIAITGQGVIYALIDKGEGVIKLAPIKPAKNDNVGILNFCVQCHALNADQMQISSAPPLVGALDREIASVDGYAYSSTLRAMNGAWTAESLRLFLKDPQQFAPGSYKTPTQQSDFRLRNAIEALRNLE